LARAPAFRFSGPAQKAVRSTSDKDDQIDRWRPEAPIFGYQRHGGVLSA
jgi:hypothetical protein